MLGFERFDPALTVAGVIFNRAGGTTHRRWLGEALASSGATARCLGAIPFDGQVTLPQRHLGLVTAAEGGYSPALRRRLAELIAGHVDVDGLIATARSGIERGGAPLAAGAGNAPRSGAAHAATVTIGVARDRAFQFYYPDNLEALERAGARLVFWSPVADRALPDADGLYLGGGYPELYGRELAANGPMREAICAFAASGRPLLAECGGLMYLAESLTDLDGHRWPMAGVLPADVVMERGRLVLGYREVTLDTAGPLGPAGTRARGHEFHCSRLGEVPASIPRLFAATDGSGGTARPEGFAVGGASMSYIHLHFGSNPALADNLVAACRH